jgi:protoheme IX farnesyltransferase
MIERTQPQTLGPARAAALATLDAWTTLTKPRITSMAAFAAFVGGLLASGPEADLARVLEASLWLALVAASSATFNQVLERDVDARMRRTASRPLVTGRIAARDATLFAAALGAVGVAALGARFNALAALLALATLAAYTLVYTPLKRVSTLNTAIGAIPGAMPPLLGFVALSGGVGPWAWYLFATLFAWQFPHFLAIAFLHREDYARAGLKMLPSVAGARGIAGRQAFLYAATLVPLSLLPVLDGAAGGVYAAAALALGAGYAAAAAAFAWRESERSARVLLLASLVHLPALFSITLMDPLVRLSSAHLLP